MSNIANFKNELLNHITCKSPLIYIKSFDFNFIHEVLFEVLLDYKKLDETNIKKLDEFVKIWDHRNSCRSFNKSIPETDKDIKLDDCLQALNDEIDQEANGNESADDFLRGSIQDEGNILVLKEPFEISIEGEKKLNATTISLLHNFACMNEKRSDNKRSIIILISCDDVHISELDPYFQRINEPLPDYEDIINEMGLRDNFENELKNTDKDDIKLGKYNYGRSFLQDDENHRKVINSFLGMKMHDIRKVLHDIISLNEMIVSEIEFRDKVITIDNYINIKKKEIVSSSGLLEIVEYMENHHELVGNVKGLIDYVDKQKDCIKKYSKQYINLPNPKGLLLVGAPGCGKSESVKAIASRLKLPLLRLDIGKLMGRFVGQSENNLINAIYIAEAAQPCVLWIDELEKAFAGFSNNGENDITVTRMIGYFLTWMQEHKTKVYLVATANELTSLKPELLRKGRWDEIFYLSYPDKDGVEKIIDACVNKYLPSSDDERDNLNSGVKELFKAKASDISQSHLSGADIDDLIVQYLRFASNFEDGYLPEIPEPVMTCIKDKASQRIKKEGKIIDTKINEYKLSIIASGGKWDNMMKMEIEAILKKLNEPNLDETFRNRGYKSAASSDK